MSEKRAPRLPLIHQVRLFVRNEQVVLSVLAIVIGAAAGLAAVGFRHFIDMVQLFFYGFSGPNVSEGLMDLPWWHIVLVPVIGGGIVGVFIRYFLPDGKPQGVQHVIEGVALKGGRMSFRTGIRAAVASAFSIGVGASVGREGPVVHLGASLGSWISKRLSLGYILSRTLLGCGVAAAVASSFNAPIAGVFFALEVVVGHYALSAFAPIVIASVVGTIISRIYYGDFPAFILPKAMALGSFWEFPAFALLGVVSAIAAIAFMRSVIFAEDKIGQLKLPFWLQPMAGGLVLGLMALVFPQIIGVGYEATDAAISELYPLWLLLALIVVKTAATAISFGSGFSGGVFSPSLFIGAMVGGAYGIIATSFFPELSSGYGAYTLIGMGAVAGAVLGAPISTILMIFELTNDYALTIAVMIATSLATVITQQVHGRSFFMWQLERRGIEIRGGREASLMRGVTVADMVQQDITTIAPDAALSMVRQELRRTKLGQVFVVDEKGSLKGSISFIELAEGLEQQEESGEAATALGIARRKPVFLVENANLEQALQLHGASGEVYVPVVNNAEDCVLKGVLHEHDVALAYKKALEQARAEERGES
ncbi:chloride channel protein [Kiloniella laminariae]|uniref:Chloride channel protein n=1 Tax=Kiloniella laminariae TaxID=454162 RepID=A0ABT4LDU6_9PROT|nr:chloride channel protein [Kiloniella laminariae]MCZ4279272.1 chloride channel protein [Kiloniella laminariae]